jgi:hypothetical protein
VVALGVAAGQGDLGANGAVHLKRSSWQ